MLQAEGERDQIAVCEDETNRKFERLDSNTQTIAYPFAGT